MQIQEHISLLPYNTFGIDLPAEQFTELHDINDLPALSALPFTRHVLGGGSNILLVAPVKGLVIRSCLKGISVVKSDEYHIWLKVHSGERWHDVVMHAVNNGWGGMENLALIPGTAGAAPIQNIGAYGAEVKETIDWVTCWHWDHKKFMVLNNMECRFGYRDSIFKQALKGKVLITSVVFKLSRYPVIRTTYGSIADELKLMGITQPGIKDVAKAVMNIRSSKLPDPAVIGNAGSFFKNPVITQVQFTALIAAYPAMPNYPQADGSYKIPAGWLIESCGLKGLRTGQTGVHAKQALVLVNYGGATGSDIWKLSDAVVQTVHEKFGVKLEREVEPWQ